MATDPGGISGIGGDVVIRGVQLCEVTKWTAKETANNPSYSSNCSGGSKRRRGGVTDMTGSIEGKWDSGRPPYGDSPGQLRPGQPCRLFLYIDAYQYIDVHTIIDEFDLTVDMDTGDIVSWTANWSQSRSPTWNVGEESSESSSSSSGSSSTNSSSSSS